MAKKALVGVKKDVPSQSVLPPEARGNMEALVHELNGLNRGAALQTAYSIGKLVVDRLFGGDVSLFRQRGEGEVSLRALSEHPGIEVKHTALWYAVALHENYGLLGAHLASALTMGHHRLLAHVADAEVRRSLAQRALGEDLSVRALEVEVKDTKKPAQGQNKRGRKVVPAGVKSLARAVKVLDSLSFGPELDQKSRAKALANAKEIAAKAATAIAQLGAE
jgi:hypothetical protein